MKNIFLEERQADELELVPELALGAGHKLLRVGVLFSGGPAPGGHNVVYGLLQALKKGHKDSQLLGFVNGPSGLIDKDFFELERDVVKRYKNVGGFHLLGTGRTKIESEGQFAKAFSVVEELRLDGLVFIGGDDTNSNAFHFAEYLKDKGSRCSVVGVPKTIDGDLRGKGIEASFGFDTACKMYAQIIGNICFDALSSQKYWHFIKLMGRKASHITLECALQTHPNAVFIGEEIEKENTSLSSIVAFLVDTIVARAKKGKNFGVVLIPEGLIEFIPEFKVLVSELNGLLAEGKGASELKTSKALFDSLPKMIQEELCLERDSHGNVQVAKIETEKLLSTLVREELERRNSTLKFQSFHHFLGYEGRSGYPSYFDATYCYNLGYLAAKLVSDKRSGFITALQNLSKPVAEWKVKAIDLSTLMTTETRKGRQVRVVEKSLVNLNGPVFKELQKHRKMWRLHDDYNSPGPMQFTANTNSLTTRTLQLESEI